MRQDPRPRRRRLADRAQAPLRGAGGRPRDRGRRRGRGRQARDRALPRPPARRRHAGHDAAGDDRARRDRVHHGALPDADPGRLVVVQPRRAVQDLRRAGRRRGRRAREAERGASRTASGSEPAGAGQAGRAHQRDHPSAARLAGLGQPPAAGPGPAPCPRAPAGASPLLVAIGASTGGPAALVEVLRGLPAAFRLPILLVLHINEPFGAAFAEWLDGQTAQRVSYARDGETIAGVRGAEWRWRRPAGTSWSAGEALRPHRRSASGTPAARRSMCSSSRSRGNTARAAAGVLLTGMGRDGAAGLLEIRRAGGLTIAQDEATSVVYGMPREAALLGAAERDPAAQGYRPGARRAGRGKDPRSGR